MEKIIIYHKKTCTKSRQGLKYLQEKGIEFDIVKYHETPLTKNKLKTLLKKMNMQPAELLRKKEKAYKELDFKNKNYTNDQIIEFMIKEPNLMERPIIEKGDKAVVARPTERIEEVI
ncbi:MAG: arsenate reductase (glutaredoxin) [Bacteroidota bacterium]